jgi:hypothetical protein
MMAGTTVPPADGAGTDGAGKGAPAVEVTPKKEKAKRIVRQPLERAENLAGTSGVPARGQPLIPIINRLLEPVQSSDDLEQTKEVLEGTRQARGQPLIPIINRLLEPVQSRDDLEQTKEVLERERFNRQLREYEAAQGFTPVVTRHSRIEEVRTRGRDLKSELGKDSRAKTHSATSTLPKVIYSSPVKNLRAAAEVAKELSSLSGEALREQQARLNQLLSEASKQ